MVSFRVTPVALTLSLLSAASSSADNDQHRHESGLCGNLDDHADRMMTLPGWNQPLPSRWFSGYLDYEFEGQQIHTHYALIQAEQIGDKDINEKPLIYWSNGGPGASSLFGLFTELGPLLLSDDSLNTMEYKKTGIPSPIYNPYSWTRLGSILIIDQPAPVGFSFCGNDTEKESQNCGNIKWTDELTSLNSYTALQEFYKMKFPCYKSKELYLTGESYAGIYVPTLARRIFNDPNSGIHLKGFAVGDGCLGTETSMCGNMQEGFVDFWHIVFMAGHHQIPLADFQLVMKACNHHDQPGFLISGSRDDAICKAALAKVKREVGGFFEYSLYDECTYRNGLLQGGLNSYSCGGGIVLEEYLKIDEVKTALHVTSNFFETDNAEGSFDYTPTEPDLTGFYKEVNGKLKVLVYNGDTDPAITSFAAQNWTSHLGFDELEHWRPWTLDSCKRMGGYVVRYDGSFDFITIRGSGHMVPTEKPEATFTFIQAWMHEVEYPAFDPNCTKPLFAEAELPVHPDAEAEAITSMLRG